MNDYRDFANLFRLMAHPVRLQILDLLRRDAECVCHLSTVLGKPQPYVSQQLAVLRNAGLIVDQKDGNNVFYQLADERVMRQVAAAFGAGAPAARVCAAGCPCPKCGAAG